MKITNLILGIFILSTIAFVFYFSRQIFYYQYEPEYYENWYYHSQWNIPNSTRGIGDGDLYKFIGYRLVEGENPFNINYEVPPFGKLLFGIAEKTIGNPYLINILIYFLSLGVFFSLTKNILKKSNLVLPVMFLFVSTPLVATQMIYTMLDLLLMFLLLTHTWLFIKYLSNQNLKFLIASGIFLGLFTGTKIGIYTPLIGILGAIMILVLSKNKIIHFLLYFSSVITGYVLAYISYFLKHPNPIPWLRLHEKPIDFYLNSSIPVDHLNQWKTIFLNSYQGWWNPGTLIHLNDWSLILPLGTLSLFAILIYSIKKQKKDWLYICGITLIFLFINSFILFWPRYLIPIIPFFVLLIAFVFKKYSFIIFLLALINLPFLNKAINFDTLPDTSQGIATSISTRAYRELYRNLIPSTISEESFINQNKLIWDQLDIRTIEMKVNNITTIGENATVKYQLKYITKYGEIIENPTLNFTQINNQWKLNWQWNYLFKNYSPESKIIIQKEILTKKDNSTQLIPVYIIPRLMSRTWNESLNSLSELTDQNSIKVDQQIKKVVPDQFPQFVGYLKPDLGNRSLELISKTSGSSLGQADYYISPTNSVYYVPSKIFLEDNQGKKTFLNLKPPSQ